MPHPPAPASARRAAREVVIPYRPRTVWESYHASDARWRVVVALLKPDPRQVRSGGG
jgi:hypothetical protein